ncbi:cytochrome c3 family protein [Geobacter sp. AOG2]|uniref:cytochrome c3 family protein n=1 Tax=Geobacter sp. AOG2 TaxID=1566347 RepID=UPI001CC3D13B|nr:cytochrome c3 family protein [Geobacter sp. AOG2]GFE59551.1 hypothetical protein AOG2_01390 [Geobacter sp. AOG2]
MKKTITASMILVVVAALLAGTWITASAKEIVATLKHKENNLTCADCHGTATPTAFVPSSVCIRCHDSGDGTYRGKLDAHGEGVEKEYRESGRIRKMSIHDSHQGPVRCTVCHSVHKKPAEKIYCNWCHKIDVKAP